MQVWRAPADRPLEIVLSDNSRVTLNRTGVLTAAFRASEREVMLSPGSQATFEVTHKPARPFRIAVDGARVEVVGTRFDVDDGGGELRVSVDRGAVNVGLRRVVAGVAADAGLGAGAQRLGPCPPDAHGRGGRRVLAHGASALR